VTWRTIGADLHPTRLHLPKRLPAFFSAPEESAGFLLGQATHLWQRRQRRALAPLALTPVQFFLLAGVVWLTRDGVPITQRALARHVRTDVMMTSQIVRALHARKLLRRTDHPRDSRAHALLPSAAGRKLARAAAFIMKETEDEFLDAIGGDGTRLRGLLGMLTTASWSEAEGASR